MPKIFSRYDVPLHEGVIFRDQSLAQQHFKDDADINIILAKYDRTGFLVDPLNPATNQPSFGDFSSVSDFHQAQNIIAYSNQAFDQLPASLRKRFNNDPSELLAFVEDENNREEAIKLGIVEKTITSDPVPAPAFVPTE